MKGITILVELLVSLPLLEGMEVLRGNVPGLYTGLVWEILREVNYPFQV
jgi:hypothetical protein